MNARLKYITISVCTLLFIILSSYLYILNTTFKNDMSNFTKHIETREKVTDIEIVKSAINDGDIFLLYKGPNDEGVSMVYFEPHSILINRYVYGGGASSSYSFDTFNAGMGGADSCDGIGGSEKNHHKETLIVLYGDNSAINADAVEFTNDHIIYREEISDDDYILTVHRLFNNASISAENLRLLDANGDDIAVY